MRLDYSEANKAGKLNIAAEIIAAILLGVSSLMAFLSTFGLSWLPNDLSGDPAGGMIRVWDAVADKLGSTSYMILDKFNVSDHTGSSGTGYGMFAAILLVAFVLIAFFVIKSRFRFLLLIFVIPVLIFAAAFRLSPGMMQAAALGASLLIALSVMNAKGKIRPSFFLVPLVAVALGVAGASAINYTFYFDRPAAVENAAEKVDAAIDRMRYGENALPEGDLANMTGKELKARRGDIDDVKDALTLPSDDSNEDAALKVKMEKPVSLYLRGYVGAEYDENRWKELSTQDFYGKRDDIYWLNKQGFDGLVQVSEAAKLGGAMEDDQEISVEVMKARKRVAFTPYELTCDGVTDGGEIKLPKKFDNYGGSFLGNKGVFGSSKYSYTISGDHMSTWTDAVGRFYTSPKTEEKENYFLNESNYNVSVYEDYLDIPDGIVSAIAGEVGSPGDITVNHADYKNTIETVKGFLKDKFIYSEVFGKPEGKEDFIKTFLREKRGTDVHFASLAVMMFRFYGIPARYIEGYLITPANIDGKMDGDSVTVSKAANHAWPEIYIDGFGWVPLEVTPEYEGIMNEPDMTKGLDNFDYDNEDQDQERRDKKDAEEDTEDEESSFMNLFMKIMAIILIALLSLALLALLVFIGLWIAKWIKWRLAFRDKDPRKGVRALYQYGNEKKYEFSKAACEIGNRASYSTKEVTEGDRTSMKKELQSAKEKTKETKRKEAELERAKKKEAAKEKAAGKAKEKAEKEKAKKEASVKETELKKGE